MQRAGAKATKKGQNIYIMYRSSKVMLLPSSQTPIKTLLRPIQKPPLKLETSLTLFSLSNANSF